jgi:hypothetical protein
VVDEPEIITIAISGSAGQRRRRFLASINPGQPTGSDPEQDPVKNLNGAAEEIASHIEREVRKVLGPQFTVQAEISFSTGSIIIEGTVAILCWTGGAALEGIKREIGELVRVAVKRILVDFIGDVGGDASGLEISSTVRSASAAREIVQPTVSASPRNPVLQLPPWLSVTAIAATVGVVLLVLDRLASLALAHVH